MAAAGYTLSEAMLTAGQLERLDGVGHQGPGDNKNFPYGKTWDTLYWIRMGWWYFHLVIKPKIKGEDPKQKIPPAYMGKLGG